MNADKVRIQIAISGPQGAGKTEILHRVYKALAAAEYHVVDVDNTREQYGPRTLVEIFTTNKSAGTLR